MWNNIYRLRKSNGNFEKQNRCEIPKQQIFKMYIKSKLYILDKIFDNNVFAKRKRKVALKLNKPPYIGMSILEFNKVLIYEIHYKYIKNKYENKSKLLIIATDSLIYEI